MKHRLAFIAALLAALTLMAQAPALADGGTFYVIQTRPVVAYDIFGNAVVTEPVVVTSPSYVVVRSSPPPLFMRVGGPPYGNAWGFRAHHHPGRHR